MCTTFGRLAIRWNFVLGFSSSSTVLGSWSLSRVSDSLLVKKSRKKQNPAKVRLLFSFCDPFLFFLTNWRKIIILALLFEARI